MLEHPGFMKKGELNAALFLSRINKE
jgi:hypothetical protein